MLGTGPLWFQMRCCPVPELEMKVFYLVCENCDIAKLLLHTFVTVVLGHLHRPRHGTVIVQGKAWHHLDKPKPKPKDSELFLFPVAKSQSFYWAKLLLTRDVGGYFDVSLSGPSTGASHLGVQKPTDDLDDYLYHMGSSFMPNINFIFCFCCWFVEFICSEMGQTFFLFLCVQDMVSLRSIDWRLTNNPPASAFAVLWLQIHETSVNICVCVCVWFFFKSTI